MRIVCLADPVFDPNVYLEPDKFDMYHFYNLRNQVGQENGYQYITTSPQYLLFGHGTYMCPGRFFTSNEMKIVLCHLLLKYDMKLLDSEYTWLARLQVDLGWLISPEAKIMIRRRQEEIDLDKIAD